MAINQRRIADSHWRSCAAFGVLLAGVASVPAGAQTVNEPINELSFTAELRHDSNVARSDQTGAVQRGLTRSDERLSLGASLVLARPLGRNKVAVDAYLGYDFYRRNSELNRERIAVSGDLELHAGPCQVNLLPRFNRQQSELYDLAFVNLPGIDSVRNTQTTQVYRGEVRCGRPTGFRPLAFYERSYGDNSNLLRQISDYRGETFGGGVSYTHPVVGSFDLSLERQNLKYPNRPLGFGLSGFQMDQIRLATTRDIGAVLSMDGYVAYSHLKPKNAGVPDFKGLSWSLGLTAAPLPDLRVRANLAQSLQPSLGTDAVYQRNRDWLLGVTYQLSAKTGVSLTGSRSERSYRGVGLGGLPQFALEEDRLDRISARIDFRATPRLGFGLEGGHERRDANGIIYDYNNTYVALNTRFTLGGI